MTFSCIKFKKKFKMKFSLTNNSQNVTNCNLSGDGAVKEPPASNGSSTASRSSSMVSASGGGGGGGGVRGDGGSKSTSSKSSKSYSALSNLDLNTSTTGLCRTSSSPNETVTNSYNVSKSLDVIRAEKNNKEKEHQNTKKFKLKKKPKKPIGMFKLKNKISRNFILTQKKIWV